MGVGGAEWECGWVEEWEWVMRLGVRSEEWECGVGVDGNEEREWWVMRSGVRSGSVEWECGWVEEWEWVMRLGVGVWMGMKRGSG